MATSEPTAESVESCPECPGSIHDDGHDRVCASCGLVVGSDPIDHGKEWRSFEPERRRTKSSNRNLADRGLGSMVGSWSERSEAGKLPMLNRFAKKDRRDRSRGYVTGEVHRMGSALELPEHIVTGAKDLYRELREAVENFYGGDLDEIAAACVYATCRMHQRGLVPAEVARVARTDAQGIERRHRWAMDALGLEVPPPDPRQRIRVVAGVCEHLGQSDVDAAIEALESVPEEVVYSGSPSTLAAALLWDVSGTQATQAVICEAAGVTPPSIRNRLRAMGRKE